MTDPSEQDLKALWMGQETETDPMTLEQIHALVGKYDRKTRMAGMIIAPSLVVTGALGALAWQTHPDPLGRAGAVLYLLGVTASFLLIARMNFPQRDPAESSGAFLRRRLQRQLAAARGGWLLMLLPVVPAMIVIGLWIFRQPPAASHGPVWAKYLPLVVLAGAWAAVAFNNLRRQTPRIKADLEELDRLMKG
jgi:hypothetical protein